MSARQTCIGLGFLTVAILGQMSLAVNPSTASHNCYRPPYHCFFMFGTYESAGVASISQMNLPSIVLTGAAQPSVSTILGPKGFVYTTDPRSRIEVELGEEAKEYMEKNKITKATGLLSLMNVDGKWFLVDFHPSDEAASMDSSESDNQAFRRYIERFEHALLLQK